MQKRMALLLLLCLLALSACASRDSVQNLQRDMDEAKNRIYQMEKDIGSIRVEAKEGTDNTVKSYQKEIENLRKTIADLQAAQDTYRVDLQSLSGKVDDIKQLSQKPSEEVALLKEDTDRRLLALEGKAANPEQKDATAKAKDATPEGLYQHGLEAYKGGDMKKARETLSKFVGLYPKHDLVANAHYWVGESYYNEKNYEQAILEFQEVIQNFPQKEKVPAAMLKQGLAFKSLGDDKSARYILKKLVADYPRSEEAKKAKEKLKNMK